MVLLTVGLERVHGAPESQKLMAETQAPQLNGGLRVESDGLGSGEPAKSGETLHIHYKGALTEGYVIFDEGISLHTPATVHFTFLAPNLSPSLPSSALRPPLPALSALLGPALSRNAPNWAS